MIPAVENDSLPDTPHYTYSVFVSTALTPEPAVVAWGVHGKQSTSRGCALWVILGGGPREQNQGLGRVKQGKSIQGWVLKLGLCVPGPSGELCRKPLGSVLLEAFKGSIYPPAPIYGSSKVTTI